MLQAFRMGLGPNLSTPKFGSYNINKINRSFAEISYFSDKQDRVSFSRDGVEKVHHLGGALPEPTFATPKDLANAIQNFEVIDRDRDWGDVTANKSSFRTYLQPQLVKSIEALAKLKPDESSRKAIVDELQSAIWVSLNGNSKKDRHVHEFAEKVSRIILGNTMPGIGPDPNYVKEVLPREALLKEAREAVHDALLGNGFPGLSEEQYPAVEELIFSKIPVRKYWIQLK